MKYCKDCVYCTSVVGRDWYLSKLFCKCDATKSYIDGLLYYLPECVDVRNKDCRSYKRKWWKFWAEK